MRRKPFSVVLFDEVEKAHPDIFNSLLQILEEGRLTDSQGRKVDFKNTVIIMTTNLGTRDINKGVLTGFQTADNSTHDYGRMKAKVAEELKQHFRPEFLNRVDDTIVFPPLTKPEIARIVDLMIAKLAKRMEAQDMRLQLTDEARELLADVGFDPVLGARPLRRAIQRESRMRCPSVSCLESCNPVRLSRLASPERVRSGRSPSTESDLLANCPGMTNPISPKSGPSHKDGPLSGCQVITPLIDSH